MSGESIKVPDVLKSMSRSDLVMQSLNVSADIDKLNAIKQVCATNSVSGIEAHGNTDDVLANVVVSVKERYGANIEPTIAGVEGFLDSLKNVLSTIGEALKGKPNKEALAKIKKYLSEASAAVKEYGSDAWLTKQEFYGEGTTKMQVPAGLKGVKGAGDLKGVLSSFLSEVDKMYQAQLSNAIARQKAGLPIFNKFKNKEPSEENLAALAKLMPVKPDAIARPGNGAITGKLSVTLEKGELPVLDKGDVKTVVGIITEIIALVDKWEKQREALFIGPSYEDFYNSNFFEDETDTKAVSDLIHAVEWDNASSGCQDILWEYNKVVFPICKFLEMWILNSCK